MANTALRFVTNTLYNKVVSPAHGFSVGDVLRLNGGTYALAQADTAVKSEVIGIISSSETNAFFITQVGYVTGLPSLPYVAGTLYYLDPATPGALTATKPVTVGQYVAPLFIADSTTSGYFFCNTGEEVGGGSSSFTWNEVLAVSANMAVANGYIANDAGLVTLTMPAAAAVGDEIRVASKGAGGWLVAQNASQSIRLGNVVTTVGVGGSLASTALGDCLHLACTTTNTGWEVLSAVGNITII